ncbi:MAG: hypothetical protein P4L41_16335 [Flavipsychrobacter sp.]|nr:hypothetical protein [Flavipsychrobacter sp.]
MPLFNISFSQLVKYILPVRLRGTVMQAWLNVLVSPVVFLYNIFIANRATNVYRLSHNGQVVYMQAVLNDTFDNALRRITIVDAIYADVVPVYLVTEQKPRALYMHSEAKPIPLYTDKEVQSSIAGFVVQVPTGVAAFDVNRMSSLIDKYRLPGMLNYKIVRI